MELHVALSLFLIVFQLATQSTAAAGRVLPTNRDSLTNQLLKGEQLTWRSTKDSQPPPIPAWPQTFSTKFYVYVEQYGNDWSSTGILYYDWTSRAFRADYIDWCLPLFGSDYGSNEFDNYTCSFLAANDNMYFVNHTAGIWEKEECCLFEGGLGPTPPDWMKNDQYNGTATIRDTLCDVWWFPGTNDPNKPCYGYWNAKDDETTPMRFFGLSSLGPTILDYFDFKPGTIPPDISIKMPNANCDKECVPPQLELTKGGKVKSSRNLPWPPANWPTCE